MKSANCSILTLTPYRVLPAKTGGQISIVQFHHYLGLHCPNHMVSTKDNEDADKYAFELHKVFASSPTRYLPLNQYQKIVNLGKVYDSTAVFCDHPYMAFTAMAVAKKLGIPWFLRSHNIEAERFRTLGKKWWRLLFMYERFAMQQANGIFFVTNEDAEWAIQQYGIAADKCFFIPFGTPMHRQPDAIHDAKARAAKEYNIDPSKKWLYFLGVLDYQPNADAVQHMLDDVLPQLQKDGGFEMLIAGKGLPQHLAERIEKTDNISYLGFVQDLDLFLQACDIMVNPVLTGGGIKTKLVEALAHNKLAVSTEHGAMGILKNACGKSILVTPDNDWTAFAHAIRQISKETPAIPASFYENYYWGNLAKKAIEAMSR